MYLRLSHCPDERQETASFTFLTWLSALPSSIFWISGKPGSGKSTLMKFLADHPETAEYLSAADPNKANPKILSHFIWIAGQSLEARIKGLLCSLTCQILQDDRRLGLAILSHFPNTRSKDSHTDWSEKELKDLLFILLKEFLPPVPVCIFIDGLDEISPADGQILLLELLGELQQVKHVKLCVASRAEVALQAALQHCPSFRMQDVTYKDIHKFASETLRVSFQSSHLGTAVRDHTEFVREICNAADGVFLWVALAVKSLKNGLVKEDTVEDLLKRLYVLPKDLVDLYGQMWSRLGDDEQLYRKDAAIIFNIFYALHNLGRFASLRYLLLSIDKQSTKHIINMAPGSTLPHDQMHSLLAGMKRRVDKACAGLLEVSPEAIVSTSGQEDYTVRFVHRSAVEFLKNHEEGRRLLAFDDETDETRKLRILDAVIASLCIGWTQNQKLNQLFYHVQSVNDIASWTTNLRNNGYLSTTGIKRLAAAFDKLLPPPGFISTMPTAIRHPLWGCQHLDLFGFLVHQNHVRLSVEFLGNLGSITSTYSSYLFNICYSRPPKGEKLPREYLRKVDPSFQGFACLCRHESRWMIHRSYPAFHFAPQTPILVALSSLSHASDPKLSFSKCLTTVKRLLANERADKALSRPAVLHFAMAGSDSASGPSTKADQVVWLLLASVKDVDRIPFWSGHSLWIETDVMSVLEFVLALARGSPENTGVKLPSRKALALGLSPHFKVESATVVGQGPDQKLVWTTKESNLLGECASCLRVARMDGVVPSSSVRVEGFSLVMGKIRELGKAVSLEELEGDWLARDVVWRYDDPRGYVPKRHV